MPRLATCSRDFHWQWINWTLLYDTMEVSMLRLAWLAIAQHVFQPALSGRLELISRKIVSCERRAKAITVSRFREKLDPRSYRDFVKNIALLGAKKWGPTCDRDISNSVIYTTAIYREYTVVKTLQNAYLQSYWMDFLHSKFYGIVDTCSCAASWLFSLFAPHGPMTFSSQPVGPD